MQPPGHKKGMAMKGDAIKLPFACSGNTRYALLFLLLLAIAPAATSQRVYVYDSCATLPDLSPPAKAIRHISLPAVHFTKQAGNRINFLLVGSEYRYILLKLNAAAACAGQCLCIDNTSLDTVSIYRLYPNGSCMLLYQGGNLVAYDSRRAYVWHTVPLELQPTPSFYLLALKASQKNINVKYEILDAGALQNKYRSNERLIFVYADMISMIALIIILAFFLFKKAVFAAYLGYIVCVSGWIFSHYGRLFPFMYPHHPVINEVAKPVSSLGGCLFLFIVLYLVFGQQLQYHRWLRQLVKTMLYLLPLLTALMLLLLVNGLHGALQFALMAGWQTGIICSFCIIMFIPLFLLRSGATAKIFSAAMLVIGMMAVVQFIANYGYIDNYFINEHGMAAGSLLEVSVMACGLFNSLVEEKKQKEKQVLTLEQEQTETLKKLITVQDDERKRIAGDLHDNIGPLLAALKINFRRILHAKEGERRDVLVTKTESIIDDSIAEIRNVAHNLMPKGLSSNGLINTLAAYFEGIQQLYSITIVFHHQVQSILHPDLQINVYRIICELVLNAARHSNGRLVTVTITAGDQLVFACIHDDGQGFRPKAGNQKTSLGLQSAESRVLYMKGKFELKTAPGMGTMINIELPL